MLVCNRKIEKRRGNFPDAIFGVNVQFFEILNYAYLRLKGQNMHYNYKGNENDGRNITE